MSEHSNPESCVTWYFRTASEEDECHCAEVLAEMGGKREWWCEYPEFNDPNCMTGMTLPAPGAAALPRKHSMCRWVWIVEKVGATDG
jgi:hypothetical protein